MMYIYIYVVFSPKNLQSWDSHDFISPEPLRCLCIGVLNPWINGKPFDVFRHLDVAVFVSSNVTLRLMRSHVPKAIPAQKCQIKNWACWSTPEIKKRLPCRFAVLRFQQLRGCRAISLKCRRPKQHWFVLVAAGTLMQQNRWNKCQLPCIRRL